MKLSRILSVFGILVLAACTQAGLFALNLPSSKSTSVKDVSFGPEDWQKLDIYIPEKSSQKTYDVVVFYYGGRWETGRREDYKFIGQSFTDLGFVTVIADYRKYPEVKFPAFVEDAARSLSWVYDNIDAYGGDKSRIHVAGHSAGAHIGALLAADPQYLKAFGKERSIIHDFTGLAGPYAFTPDEADLIDIFGPADRFSRMQVPGFIDGKQPPMLLLHGAEDKTVGTFNIDRVVAAVHKKGGCVRTKIYPGLNHISILTALSWLGKGKSPVLSDMADYFRENEHKDCR